MNMHLAVAEDGDVRSVISASRFDDMRVSDEFHGSDQGIELLSLLEAYVRAILQEPSTIWIHDFFTRNTKTDR